MPTLPALVGCAHSEGRGGGYTDIDQSAALAHGPVGRDLPETPTLRRIRERGALVQSGSKTTPGFAMLDPASGELTGFDAGVAQLLAKYLLGEPAIELVVAGADVREAMLQNHSVDVAISTYTINPERARLVSFAGPYYVARSAVVVAEGETGLRSVADLAGREIAVQPGAAEEALLAAAPSAKPVIFEETSQCRAAVRQGRVPGWSGNDAILTGQAAVDREVRMAPLRFGASPFGIGSPKDDPQFNRIVEGFLRRIYADGTWRLLWRLTVGELRGGSPPRPPRLGSVAGA